jgi:hypothetical protein
MPIKRVTARDDVPKAFKSLVSRALKSKKIAKDPYFSYKTFFATMVGNIR